MPSVWKCLETDEINHLKVQNFQARMYEKLHASCFIEFSNISRLNVYNVELHRYKTTYTSKLLKLDDISRLKIQNFQLCRYKKKRYTETPKGYWYQTFKHPAIQSKYVDTEKKYASKLPQVDDIYHLNVLKSETCRYKIISISKLLPVDDIGTLNVQKF